MRPTFHETNCFCGICGNGLPGPAKHAADRVSGAYTFYCGRCRNLIIGKRKVKPDDIQRVVNHAQKGAETGHDL
jgi:hypothetical protein